MIKKFLTLLHIIFPLSVMAMEVEKTTYLQSTVNVLPLRCDEIMPPEKEDLEDLFDIWKSEGEASQINVERLARLKEIITAANGDKNGYICRHSLPDDGQYINYIVVSDSSCFVQIDNEQACLQQVIEILNECASQCSNKSECYRKIYTNALILFMNTLGLYGDQITSLPESYRFQTEQFYNSWMEYRTEIGLVEFVHDHVQKKIQNLTLQQR